MNTVYSNAFVAVDLGAPPNPPSNGLAIINDGGALKLLGANGAKSPLSNLSDNSRRTQLMRSAEAFVGAGGYFWLNDGTIEDQGLLSFVQTGGSVGFSQTALNAGRQTSGRIFYTHVAPNGYYEWHNAYDAVCADMRYDPWYIGWGGIVVALDAGTETMLVGLSPTGQAPALNDVGGQPYVYLGYKGSQSLTNAQIGIWDGTTKTYIDTGMALDVGFNHAWALANDGLGTLYVLKDGAVGFTVNNVLAPIHGAPGFWFMNGRQISAGPSKGAIDYWCAAGVVQ